MKNNIFNENASQLNLFSVSDEDKLLTSNKIEITDEFLEVFKLLKSGVPVVFVNGPGGTGKSTFIGHIRESVTKNIVILAPTGIAAMNAKGMTINSFCRFPPRMITDDDIVWLNKTLVQSIALLIIDEVSMVRSDTMDAIDKVLRKTMESSEPFGGIQVMLVGDLFQLPPVIPPEEWNMLRQMNYKSHYFFDAKVFSTCPLAAQEFTKIYRQANPVFISLLSKVRKSEDLDTVIPLLNQRCVEVDDLAHAILTLTCTKRVAEDINNTNLLKLPGEPLTFVGEIKGEFNLEESRFPSPMHLTLKVGAQVMFTKNDASKRWFNGTLGKVVELDPKLNTIAVEVIDDLGTHVFNVPKESWESHKYTYNNGVTPEVVGSYQQYPLILAWAVTIHKAQGLTLSEVKIDLGKGSFAHGQTYVALSRCRTLEKIYLTRPIKHGDIICDPVVKSFYVKLNKKKKKD